MELNNTDVNSYLVFTVVAVVALSIYFVSQKRRGQRGVASGIADTVTSVGWVAILGGLIVALVFMFLDPALVEYAIAPTILLGLGFFFLLYVIKK
jgi:uncharacterized membrane protein YccC